jgi:hypothetical protein
MPIPDPPPASLTPSQSLDELVERVRRGEEAAIVELHGAIAQGIRFFCLASWERRIWRNAST